ncbi:hypothetical protein [Myxococcus landrumensis]|uniref:Uncharacterized protein n=1 Tax=Myxococcus landrumensis TaxID=2813577 RepID=A0ABX7NFA7_9BACT|nr:hypothetical protein [Myxococcus landrumus]QSQ17522.1 hypothetical protein JY572_16410 [Myxococcus landrumus]
MSARALASLVVAASVLWPLQVLACINSMDSSVRGIDDSIWADVSLWTVGAVFLNQVVLFNNHGPPAKLVHRTSWARRVFFLLVSVAFILVLSAVMAGGPLLNVSAEDLARCAISPAILAVMVASPAVLFGLQSAYFQGPGLRRFRGRTRTALVSVVASSLLLATGLGVARDLFVLPKICRTPNVFIEDSPY